MDLRIPLPDGIDGLFTAPPPPPAPVIKNIYNLTEEGSKQMARNDLVRTIFGMSLVAAGVGIFGYMVYQTYKPDEYEKDRAARRKKENKDD